LTHYYTTYYVSHSCQNSEVIHICPKKNQAFNVFGCGSPSVAASWYLQCQYIVSAAGFMMTGEGWEAGSCRLAYTPYNDYLTPVGGCLPLRGIQTVTA